MNFGIVTAKIDEIGYITRAENLGYTHAWVTDSPMIRSNCWAVLALAAHQTRTIRLGTGVNVPGLRLAPVAANGIATINRLAPGRCFMASAPATPACGCSGSGRCAWDHFANTFRPCAGSCTARTSSTR